MPLSDFIQIVISIDAIGIARAGFGIPLIPSANATFPERVRFYGDAPSVKVDFPSATAPENLAATALFSQDNKPSLIAIGRCANKPTQQYAIGVSALTDATAYQIRARGQGVTDTTVSAVSGTPSTLAGTHNSLIAALNAVVGKNFTAAFAPLTYPDATFTADSTTDLLTITAHGLTLGAGPFQTVNAGGGLPGGLAAVTNYFVVPVAANTFKLASSFANALAGTTIDVTTNGTGTQTLHAVSALNPSALPRVTGDAPGNWFSLEILDSAGLSTSLAPSFMANSQVHADPGIAADLDAMAQENGAWYALYTLYNSQAYVNGTATWVEAQPRIYVADTCDTHTITTAAGSGNDIGDALKASNYARTLLEYHPSPADMLGAALAGQVLPLDPGAETWAFKSNLAGPRGVKLTATHRVNIRTRNMNTYEPQTPDVTWTWDGKVSDGEFLDTIRGLDFVRDDATKSIAEVLANNPKVPYTDGGAVTLGNELEGVLARAVTAGIAAPDPSGSPPAVVIPKVATQSAANRRLRKFAGIKGSFTLAGAIQDVGPVSIVVTQ